MDRYPKLRDTYFGRYRKMVYLAQRESSELLAYAERAAQSIQLELDVRYTGIQGYESFLTEHSQQNPKPISLTSMVGGSF